MSRYLSILGTVRRKASMQMNNQHYSKRIKLSSYPTTLLTVYNPMKVAHEGSLNGTPRGAVYKCPNLNSCIRAVAR